MSVFIELGNRSAPHHPWRRNPCPSRYTFLWTIAEAPTHTSPRRGNPVDWYVSEPLADGVPNLYARYSSEPYMDWGNDAIAIRESLSIDANRADLLTRMAARTLVEFRIGLDASGAPVQRQPSNDEDDNYDSDDSDEDY